MFKSIRLFGILGGYVIYLIFIISIFIHEISHILMAIAMKCKLRKIKIVPVGFSIEFKNYYNQKIDKKILIILVGPISNFLISIVFKNYNCMFSKEICLINFWLGFVNFLPIYPLDGANILELLLKKFCVNKKEFVYSHYVSKCFLCFFTFLYSIAILKFKNLSVLAVIIFLWYKNMEKERQIKLVQNAYKVIEKTLI